MEKILKEDRLSFRMSPQLSSEIDTVIERYEFLRDRSDFGTKSVIYYLRYLKENKMNEELIMKAISTIIDKLNIKSTQADSLKTLYNSIYNSD